jgi:hypothetical protein
MRGLVWPPSIGPGGARFWFGKGRGAERRPLSLRVGITFIAAIAAQDRSGGRFGKHLLSLAVAFLPQLGPRLWGGAGDSGHCRPGSIWEQPGKHLLWGIVGAQRRRPCYPRRTLTRSGPLDRRLRSVGSGLKRTRTYGGQARSEPLRAPCGFPGDLGRFTEVSIETGLGLADHIRTIVDIRCTNRNAEENFRSCVFGHSPDRNRRLDLATLLRPEMGDRDLALSQRSFVHSLTQVLDRGCCER